MPFVGTIDYYNKSHKVEKRPSGGHKEFFMESVIAIFMVVSVMVLSVYFANWIKGSSDEKHQKLNDIFTFSLPCVATMAIGIAVISDIGLLSKNTCGAQSIKKKDKDNIICLFA